MAQIKHTASAGGKGDPTAADFRKFLATTEIPGDAKLDTSRYYGDQREPDNSWTIVAKWVTTT